MARYRVIVALAGLVIVALGIVAWRLQTRVADARDERAAWEQRFRRVCTGVHADLRSLKWDLPRYAEHVQQTHQPDVPNPEAGAVLDAAGIHFGPIYMLLSANLRGLSTTLRQCLTKDSDDVGGHLQDLRGARTNVEAEALIDELMRLLEGRYQIQPLTEVPAELKASESR